MPSPVAPGARILALWQRLARVPGGPWLVSQSLRWAVPYTGALGARIVQLEPGNCVVTLRDRRGVRNHLRSVHAIALANLGELASGLAMLTALPHGVRGIVTTLEIEYLKKARGTITGRAQVTLPAITGPCELHPEASLEDATGQRVAQVRVTWQVEPVATA